MAAAMAAPRCVDTGCPRPSSSYCPDRRRGPLGLHVTHRSFAPSHQGQGQGQGQDMVPQLPL